MPAHWHRITRIAPDPAPVGVRDWIPGREDRVYTCRASLEAVTVLGRKEFTARVVHLETVLEGEFAENEMRKDFTMSEREAVAMPMSCRRERAQPLRVPERGESPRVE